MPSLKFSEAVRNVYGPYTKNKVVIHHIEKLTANEGPSLDILPGLNDPYVGKMLTAAKKQEEKCNGGNNFVLILCELLLKGIECLHNAGIPCNEIYAGYLMALEQVLKILEEVKGAFNELSVNVNNNHNEILIKALENNESKKKDDFLVLSCEKKSTKEIKINEKKEILIAKEDGKGYYNTKVKINENFCCSAQHPTCDSIFEYDEILSFFQYRMKLANLTNRKMKDDNQNVFPVNIILYSTNINCSSIEKTEDNNCVIHEILNKLSYLDLHVQTDQTMCDAQVIVAMGQMDKFALSRINYANIVAVTVEDCFELLRLQKAIGGTLITNFMDYPKKECLGHAFSVAVEDLVDGISVAIFKIKDQSSIKTVVVRDVTTADVFPINSNADSKDVQYLPGAGVTEALIASKLNEFAKTLKGIPKLVTKNFAEALKAFSTTLDESAFFFSEMNTVDDHNLGEMFSDLDIKDRCSVANVLNNGIVDSFEEKYWALKIATECVLDII